ncbi:MAG: methyl-accepting chemotaxis protein, partial [Spirochaetes bacterium]
SAEELSSAIQEINRAAAQIMTALGQIQRGARDAASATEESNAAIVQIQSGLELAQERSAKGNDQIGKLRKIVQENKKEMEELISGIIESVETTKTSISQIKELENVSRQIDKIVDAITTVSIKTSMLAVNGSIEAARAGEYGKGFAVVSTDITNLSNDSAENSDRIKDMVRSVQDQIGAVSTDLADIIRSEIESVEEAKISTANIAKLDTDTIEVEQGMQEILFAADEISAAITQAGKGMEQISSASQEAEKAAEQAAGAAEQQAQGTEELASAVEEIASIADELQST